MTDANLLDDVTRTNIANARKRGLYFNLYKNLGIERVISVKYLPSPVLVAIKILEYGYREEEWKKYCSSMTA